MTLVSVVIPTLRRPKLLLRALDGVLGQTHRAVEVIVVVDGPDPETVEALRSVADARVRVIQNARSLTAAGARNAGIDRATGEWLAFLDDDDEWLPEKLAIQLAFAAGRPAALVTCLSQVVTADGSHVRPEAAYDDSVPLDEYLFDRRSPFSLPGFIQTSSYLIPRALLGGMRFRPGTPHDDWDLLLRLSKESRVRVETVREVLVRLHQDHGHTSLSAAGSWSESLSWIESVRPLVSDRAYSAFCLSVAGPRAAAARDWSGFVLLLARALRRGAARRWQVGAFVALWVVPRNGMRTLRDAVARGAVAARGGRVAAAISSSSGTGGHAEPLSGAGP